jgi:uncharacterized iron-regulated membrane protein
MPWVVVWPVLVVAALVGVFILGRDLWRKGKRLVAAAGAATHIPERLSAHADEMAAAAREANPVPQVALSRDRTDLLDDLATVRAARDRRLDARHARHRQVMAGWRDFWR